MTRTPDPIYARILTQPLEATLTQDGDRWTLSLSRDLDHPPERVWRMLTDPAELARWSPFVPDRPLVAPGPAWSRENPGDQPVDGEVLVLDEPRELVHRWGADLLGWTLTPLTSAAGARTRLTLRHTFGERDQSPMFGAGWHLCLAVLIGVLAGENPPRVVGAKAAEYDWDRILEAYRERLL